jgi:hypothetical protein
MQGSPSISGCDALDAVQCHSAERGAGKRPVTIGDGCQGREELHDILPQLEIALAIGKSPPSGEWC